MFCCDDSAKAKTQNETLFEGVGISGINSSSLDQVVAWESGILAENYTCIR